MHWEKKGLIFTATGQFNWMNSHAQVPTILDLSDTLRIYFSTRTSITESKIAWLDVDASNPKLIKSTALVKASIAGLPCNRSSFPRAR